MSADLLAGVYRHYKGPLYLVLGLAHDANVDDLGVKTDRLALFPTGWVPLASREVVVYVPLMLDGAHAGPRMAVRTRADWDAHVCADPGCHRYGQPFPDGADDPILDAAWRNSASTALVTCLDRHTRPRFAYLGPTYDPATTT